MQIMLRSLTLLTLLSIVQAAPVRATTAGDVVSVSLLPGWQSEDGQRMAAIRFDLAEGWKTYWRSPGDAGIPPIFNWSGSENLAGVRIHWPRPHVFAVNGMQSIGYKNELVLPIELTPIDPSKPIGLHAEIDMGVCRDICVPAAVSFSASITSGGQSDPMIRAALSDRPATPGEAGLGSIGCTVEPIEDGLRVTATLDLPPTGGPETVVFEPRAGAVWVSEADVQRAGSILSASADLVAESGKPFALDRSAMIVTVLGHDRAVEIIGCPAP
jgi:DsbC/DsbD-like thiol-disulfide interchange protein